MIENKSQYPYQPFFCEENIWHLASRLPTVSGVQPLVLFFVNQQKSVMMEEQLAMGPLQQGIWDYHVVLCIPESRVIVDFDSSLGFQVDLEHYFSKSFPDQNFIDENFRATVRLIKARDYLEFFSSDRSHMIDGEGKAIAPFPDWPMIHADSDPLRLVELRDADFRDSRLNDLSITSFLKDVLGKTK